MRQAEDETSRYIQNSWGGPSKLNGQPRAINRVTRGSFFTAVHPPPPPARIRIRFVHVSSTSELRVRSACIGNGTGPRQPKVKSLKGDAVRPAGREVRQISGETVGQVKLTVGFQLAR